MVAGGIAGMLLSDFGADVMKIEQPGVGDPLRQWTTGGEAFWWKVYARNKRLITLNLKAPEGHALLEQLVPRFDVMLESFVPGTLERMGLGWDVLSKWHPGLILLRISGWGQDGPGSARPGFGTLVEAASGFAAMNGEPDGAPIVPSFPLADMTAITLCRDNKLPILVFELLAEGNIARAVKGEKLGTLVGEPNSRD
jgi:crotonobetainyl-CoA:carnitine CoA-transferase CaiB-like acyl-CoA transferase